VRKLGYSALMIPSLCGAISFEGVINKISVPSMSQTSYALFFTKPQKIPIAQDEMGPLSFVLLDTQEDYTSFSKQQAKIEAEWIGMDRSCHVHIPVFRLNEIQIIPFPDDWNEEMPGFVQFIVGLAQASCVFARWESWVLGRSVWEGRDGLLVEIRPDGMEIIHR
jgi:hypothetical protein